MKTRTQIQLDPEDYDVLKTWTRERGISLSAAIRWLIREKARETMKSPREALTRAFVSAAGRIHSNASDEGKVSRRHDDVLYGRRRVDRKSTRLNSSHMSISYAVF